MTDSPKKRDLKKLLQSVEQRKYPKLNPEQRLSLCVIAKNEEKHLARCLESVEGVVDEIIVVDTGSTDNTVEIAKKYGAKVHFFEWCDDFSAARNFSIKNSTGDWILILDADEELSKDSREKIRAFLVDIGTDDIYYQLRIKNLDKNEQIVSQNYMVRLFKKNPRSFYYGRIHEYVIPTAGFINISDADVHIVHHGYKEGLKQKIIGRNLPILESISSEGDIEDNYRSFINYYIGVSNKSLGRIDEAISYLQKSIDFVKNEEKKPRFAIYPYIHLMNVLLTHNRISELKTLVEKSVKELRELEDAYEYWFYSGMVDFMAKDYVSTIQKMEKGIEVYNRKDLELFRLSNDIAIYFFNLLYLANANILIEKDDQALLILQKALDESSEKFDYYQYKFNIAKLFTLLNKIEKAIEICNELLTKVDPKSKNEVSTFLSNLYMRMNNFSKAITIQAEIHEPEKVKTNWYAIVEALENEKFFPAAEEVYSTIISLLPDETRAYMGRAVARLIQNKTVDALGDLAMARKKSDKPEEKVKVGLIYFQVGQSAQAKACIQEALVVEPLDYQAHLYLASIEQSEGRIDEALVRLNNLTEMFPEDSRGYIQLGNLLLSHQKVDEAINIYQKAKGLSPDNAYIPYTLSLCFLEKNDRDKALSSLEDARRLDPEDEDLKALYQSLVSV